MSSRQGWALRLRAGRLKRSMRWDERVFGREYDLDMFNVVAVSDFNMGAMENKGLNIFNDKYVLADPRDRDRRRLCLDRGDHRA
jgi:aminopeptidase N